MLLFQSHLDMYKNEFIDVEIVTTEKRNNLFSIVLILILCDFELEWIYTE